MPMMQESPDPDLNLQLLNDHGIYTIEEINELSRTVKLFCTTQNLVHFLIILNSETYGILKRKISNLIYEERTGTLTTNVMK